MPGSPASSPTFGAPRYADSDDATFSQQVNSVTDTFDGLAVRSDDPRLTDTRAPSPGSVTATTIPNASITGGKLAAQTITQANMAPASVGSAELIDASVQTSDYAPGSVTSSVLAAGAVQTQNVGNGQVTTQKLDAATQQALYQPGDLIYSAATSRAGAVLCDGRAVGRTDPVYAALFAAIGTTYGGGNGVSTFNVPDYRGRVAVMVGSAGQGDNYALGQRLGEFTHALSVNEMPAHAHGISDPGHVHGVSDPQHAHAAQSGWTLMATQPGSGAPIVDNVWNNPQPGHTKGVFSNSVGSVVTDYRSTGIGINNAATGVAVQNAGASYAHNNAQPSVGVNVFIKL
jgi:microcystin-dependent protein